jgi:hypothetical protein
MAALWIILGIVVVLIFIFIVIYNKPGRVTQPGKKCPGLRSIGPALNGAMT